MPASQPASEHQLTALPESDSLDPCVWSLTLLDQMLGWGDCRPTGCHRDSARKGVLLSSFLLCSISQGDTSALVYYLPPVYTHTHTHTQQPQRNTLSYHGVCWLQLTYIAEHEHRIRLLKLAKPLKYDVAVVDGGNWQIKFLLFFLLKDILVCGC